LEKGDVRTYQVQIINYNPDYSMDTANYQLKEVVSESQTANDETSFRLDRYRRDNEADPWVIDSVWWARINKYQAIVIEHNVPIIKLSFPIMEDKRWDGNAMNTHEFDEFKMVNVGISYKVDSINYLNSLEMFMEDVLDPIKITKDDYHQEVYSKDFGLIYKLDIDIKYCNPIDCSEPQILEGREYEQKLLEIGKIE